jgi:hypothetical protein
MTASDDHMPAPHETALLLPWYASAKLAERERLDVMAHLRDCAECRAELDSVLRSREQMRELFGHQPVPEQSMWQAVMTSVDLVTSDTLERSAPRRRASLGANGMAPTLDRPPQGAHGQSPMRWLHGSLLACADALRVLLRPRWAPTLAVMLVVLQAGMLVWRSIPHTGRDRLTTRAIAPPELTRIRVVFYPRATEQDIRSALQALGGRIVDGPATNGAYVIELAQESPLTLGRKIRVLREQSGLVQQMELVPQASNASP